MLRHWLQIQFIFSLPYVFFLYFHHYYYCHYYSIRMHNLLRATKIVVRTICKTTTQLLLSITKNAFDLNGGRFIDETFFCSSTALFLFLFLYNYISIIFALLFFISYIFRASRKEEKKELANLNPTE